jgi:hypothetical protein
MGNQETKVKKELEESLEKTKNALLTELNETERKRLSLNIKSLSTRLTLLESQENLKKELTFHRKLNKSQKGIDNTKKVAELITHKEKREREENKIRIVGEILQESDELGNY